MVIVIDARKMHTLDSVATFIWERAEQPRAIASIADDVVERFEVEPERALQDVLRFADHLVELGALEVENPGL
ncbi:MAG: PqqD family protein [Sandaracinaceae bacterium]